MAAVEAYRTLRTNLQFGGLSESHHSLLVTSAGVGEGKSLTLSNLGIALAQTGKRVILVDADLRRPSLHRFFNADAGQGLTTVLQNGATLESTVRPTSVENLLVLPAGPLPPNTAELLASERMSDLLAELKERADVVLLDSPPVLAVSDASLLAGKVDGVLVVIDTRQTRREALWRTKEALDEVGARIMGAVLNRARADERHTYYRHYSMGGSRAGKQAPPSITQ